MAEWFGCIPSAWHVSKLKNLVNQTAEHANTNEGYIGLENIESWTGRFLTKEDSSFEAEGTSIAIHSGDILFGKLRPYLAKCFIANKDGCCSTEFIVMTATDINPVLLKYIMLSPKFIDEVNMSTYGSKMPRANWSFIGNMLIPLPSPTEQSAIASYLDHKVSHIDSIIAEAKASIEEYKAWKASIIYEAVTKGLDKNVERKASNVEWIGEIASHVVISRVGMHHDIVLGKMLCPDQLDDTYTLQPYYCAANVHFDGISYEELKEMWFGPSQKQRYLINEGDLLVVEGGAGAGGCAIAGRQERNVYIQNSIMKVTPRLGHDIRYLRYLIECLVKKGYVDFVCNKATIPHFTKEKLANVPYPVFPNEEQKVIADYLDERCQSIDSLISEKESLISDLEAYKKSLIYEVVTGKRKVM